MKANQKGFSAVEGALISENQYNNSYEEDLKQAPIGQQNHGGTEVIKLFKSILATVDIK